MTPALLGHLCKGDYGAGHIRAGVGMFIPKSPRLFKFAFQRMDNAC